MNGIMESTIIRALGYVLFHSLWQFSIIAILMYYAQIRLKSAKARYLAGMIALCLMMILAIVSFHLYQGPTLSAHFSDNPSGADAVCLSDSSDINSTQNGGLMAYLPTWPNTPWMDKGAPYFVFVWLLGLLLLAFRLGAGLWGLQNLKRWAKPLKEPKWENGLQQLKVKLGIKRPVSLLASTLVHGPLVSGWIKPIIYLPIGMINQLSVQEIEAVLAHELAHITRQDWILNLIQTIIESIFYYHPAVWWISSVVRQERENCCDDIALQLTQNRLCYAKTLLRIQELATPASSVGLVLGMDGGTSALHPDKRRMFLLERIRRILNQPQPTYFNMGKFMAMLLLLALLLTGIFRANTAPFSAIGATTESSTFIPDKYVEVSVPVALATLEADSFPKGKKRSAIQRVYREEDDGKKVELEAKDGKVTKLVLDDKVIPESEYGQHLPLINSLLNTPPPPPPPAPEAPVFRDYHGYPAPPAPPAAPAAPSAPRQPWPDRDKRQGYQYYPMPPSWNGSKQVWIDGDAEGNKTIKLYGDNGATDITITDGEVFINGEKVENGQVYNLNGHVMRFQNGQFEGGPGENRDAEAPAMFFHHDYENGLHAYAPEAYQEQLKALSELRRSMISPQELEQLEKELKAAERSLEKARKESEKSAKAMKKNRKAAEKDAERAAKEELELARKMRYDNGVIILNNKKQI